MTSKTATRRGFRAPCIRCGQPDTVRIDLSDVTTFVCTECDEEWSAADVRKFVDGWQAVLLWVDTAPLLDD